MSYPPFVHFGFSLSAHVIAWRECWLYPQVYHVITWTEMGSYTLIVGVLKYFLFWGFCPLWVLSFGSFCPMVLFVHFGFSLSAHVIAWRECWLSTLVSCDHEIVHLDCWSIKIFSLLGVLSALIFILWIFCPMVLLSILAFLCPLTWRHDENVNFPQVYHVIMGSYTLIVGVLKYFLFLGVLSALSFILWFFCPMVLFVHFGFSLSAHVIAWRECWLSTLVSCDHEIVQLDCWSIKIFSLLGVLSALIFILWILCPMVLLSILAFLCPLTWRHDENVDFPQVYRDHEIVHLDCWSINIFSLLGVLSALSFILCFFCLMVL